MNEKDKNMLIEESKDPQSLEGLKGQQVTALTVDIFANDCAEGRESDFSLKPPCHH